VISTSQSNFGTLADPADFVALAQQVTNAYDTQRALELYANDATVEVIADGAREIVSGRTAIEEALERFTGPLSASGYSVKKTLLSADGNIIVNEWTGRFPGSDRSAGVEVWRFNTEGKVCEHRLFAFFDVRPVTSPIAGARVALGRPRLALRLLRARLKRAPAR
jgi:hypothetical protein